MSFIKNLLLFEKTDLLFEMKEISDDRGNFKERKVEEKDLLEIINRKFNLN